MTPENESVPIVKKIYQVLFFTILAVAFLLLFFYINIQQEKYNYLIYFYGESVSPGSPVLLRVISKDGEVVNNPDIKVNGKKHSFHLLELYPDLKEISLKVGSFETVFPVKYRDIAEASLNPPSFVQFSKAEIDNLPSVPVAGGRSLFLIPDSFRMVPEFETTVHLYCISNGLPCSDRTVFVQGMEKEFKKGYLSFRTVMTADNNIALSFHDGSSVVTRYPFYGKQFRFVEKDEHLYLNSLIETRNVHVDCFQSGKWVKTDIVNVPATGIKLPSDYRFCDRIQASFSSHSPGGTFAVYTKSRGFEAGVSDPYYMELYPFIKHFSDYARYNFERNYNSSFFIPLTVVFSGQVLEERFLKEKEEKLDYLWWSILFVSFFSLLLFSMVIYSKFKVVEGLDGELITHSIGKQRTMLAFAIAFYTIVVVSLLYLLKNLA